jgi:DNA-binding transcriptional regulator LsrR (DeoR family)
MHMLASERDAAEGSGRPAAPAAPAAPAGGADEESRERLAAVARMYYLDDLGQQAIAGIMGISRSQVSRLLTRARERGIVRITVEDHDPRDRLLERRLSERYGLRLAVVVRCAERALDPLRRSIGYVAAPAVADLIEAGAVLGLAGGRTLAALVEYLRPRAGARGITAVPLMGNIGPLASPIDAVDLSRAVAQRFGGDSYTISAPAIAQDRSARDLFLAHEHIRMVRDLFGGLSLALVGIGSLDESAFIERGVLGPAPLARLREAGAVGEVCGRFFDAHGRECPSDYGERVIGVDLESLRRCPDVVAVTNGPRRAAALGAALAGGLVTSLVIDDAGARALLRDPPDETAREAPGGASAGGPR